MNYILVQLVGIAIFSAVVTCTPRRMSGEIDRDTRYGHAASERRAGDDQEDRTEEEPHYGKYREMLEEKNDPFFWRLRSKCPKGTPRNCANPCKFASCYKYPKAQCRNACCRPKWRIFGTTLDLDCECDETLTTCPNWCATAVCRKHRKAKCVMNHCGCRPEFYLDYKKVHDCGSNDAPRKEDSLGVYTQEGMANGNMENEQSEDVMEREEEAFQQEKDHLQPRLNEEVTSVENEDAAELFRDEDAGDISNLDAFPLRQKDENVQELDYIDYQADPNGNNPPCNEGLCPKYPNAKCRKLPESPCCRWYAANAKVNCSCNATIVKCKGSPCNNATCPRYPKAACAKNYCGGCYADFYLLYEGQYRKIKSCAICPSLSCDLNCPYGYELDENSCPISKCRDRPGYPCSLPKVLKKCCSGSPPWYYDTVEERCVQAPKGECNWNENSFKSKDACKSVCPAGFRELHAFE